jgi:hypothetical protein
MRNAGWSDQILSASVSKPLHFFLSHLGGRANLFVPKTLHQLAIDPELPISEIQTMVQIESNTLVNDVQLFWLRHSPEEPC